QKFRVQ
ncbi:putative membrane protein, partial [Vibrio parahaemolyticus VPTS-2010_2]